MYQFITPPVPQRPEEIELIRSMVSGTATKKAEKRLEKLLPTPPDTTDAFVLKTAGDWLRYADQNPAADRLFGDLWFEKELCILFADANAGKSVLAVQLGEAIAAGRPIEGFAGPRQPQNVLYFDFELSASQFGRRYSNLANGLYQFSNNFYRIVLNPNAKGEHKFKTFADYLENALENFIIAHRPPVIILDNLTCLRTGTESAAGAIRLMRSLRNMRQRYGLSILVLAHTPKRKAGQPLTGNDLQGSKMLLNFADSAFALGQSQAQKGLSYLIQVKQRNAGQQYGADNICLCRLQKPTNFLQFRFEGQGVESAHLVTQKQQQQQQTEDRLLALRERGHSFNQIAAETGIPKTTVRRMLKLLLQPEESGQPDPAAKASVIPGAAEIQTQVSMSPPAAAPVVSPPVAAEPAVQTSGGIIAAMPGGGVDPPPAAIQPAPGNPPQQIDAPPLSNEEANAVKPAPAPPPIDWRLALCAPEKQTGDEPAGHAKAGAVSTGPAPPPTDWRLALCAPEKKPV